MIEISPEKLLKRLQSVEKIKYLTDYLSHSRIKIAKKVYDMSTRNIKNFIKQHRQIQMKRMIKQNHQNKLHNQNKIYDENQLLQLDFSDFSIQHQPQSIPKCKTQSSDLILTHLNTHQKICNDLNFSKNKPKNKFILNRSQRVNSVEHNILGHSKHESLDNLPRLIMRKKSNTTFQNGKIQVESGIEKSKMQTQEIDFNSKQRFFNLEKTNSNMNKSPSTILINSNKAILRKNISATQQIQSQKFVSITEEKMNRYIKSLHVLVNGTYELGKLLNDGIINKILVKRYSVPKQSQVTEESSSVQSEPIDFRLPFAEFVSEPETRKSIHRIINMPIKKTQKVVFQLLDTNRNGFIDQKDMINLAELSQKLPDLKYDFLKILKHNQKQDNISFSNAQPFSYRQNFFRQLEKNTHQKPNYLSIDTPKKSANYLKPFSLLKAKNQKSFTFSTSQITEQTNRRNYSNLANRSLSFKKNKFYAFLSSKNKFFKSHKNKDQNKFLVSLKDFQSIFKDQRPLTFYDLVKYLFGVKKQDLIHQDVALKSQNMKREAKQNQLQKQKGYQQKNYNIPEIIKDFEIKFTCEIEKVNYGDVRNLQKLTQRSTQNQKQPQI